MSKNYNTRTASLQATVADIRGLNAKQIDAEKIKLQGKDIKEVWGFQDPEDFKKLCKRVNMDELENEYYELYNDEGELIYFSEATSTLDLTSHQSIKKLKFENNNITEINISGCFNIENIDICVPNCEYFLHGNYNRYESFPDFGVFKLESFEGDISGLSDLTFLFFGHTLLTHFSAKLPPMTDSTNCFAAFYGCNLDSDSVSYILSSLQEYSTQPGEYSNTLVMTINESAVETFNSITGNSDEIPFVDITMNEGITIGYKGWDIMVTINDPKFNLI